MNKEIRDLLEKARFELPILSTNSPTRKLIGEALDLLEQQPKDETAKFFEQTKEQPTASEFTTKVRRRITTDKQLISTVEDTKEMIPYLVIASEALDRLAKACNHLDRAEASKADLLDDLLAVCEAVSQSVGDFRPAPETMFLIENAITKAKKEG